VTEGEQAGRWAMLYIYTALFTLGFTIVSISVSFIRGWFL